jgi:hypothetical protein
MSNKSPKKNKKTEIIPADQFLQRVFPIPDAENKRQLIEQRIFKPRKDCDEFRLDVPIDWEASDKLKDRNWRMQLQGWTMFHPVMNFFDEFPDKDAVLSYFFDIARDWWRAHKDSPDNATTSRMPSSYAWYDMSVGFRALVIAFFLNRIKGYALTVSDTDRELLEKLAEKHIRNLSSPEVFSLNNHGVFQAHGLMALLRTADSAENANERLPYALMLVERLVKNQFDDSGIHREHSPHYHFYVLKALQTLVETGWYSENREILTRLEKARAACKWLVDPQRRPICVGDSILTLQRSLVFPESKTDFEISDFDSSGYAVVRSNWTTQPKKASMLFLMGAYHSKTHKHRDCLSFDWFDRGERVICDGGKYGYVSDRFRHYFLSYKAHNTAEIDGFDILKIKPYGSAIVATERLDDDVFKLGGRLEYPAIRHARTIYFKPGSWVIVHDKLDYARARPTRLWFHFEADYALVSATHKTLHAKGAHEREVFLDCLDETALLELQIGNDKDMAGFISRKDYEVLPALSAAICLSGKDHSVFTCLSLDEGARQEALAYAASLNGAPPRLGAHAAQNPAPFAGNRASSAGISRGSSQAERKTNRADRGLRCQTHLLHAPQGAGRSKALDHVSRSIGPKRRRAPRYSAPFVVSGLP